MSTMQQETIERKDSVGTDRRNSHSVQRFVRCSTERYLWAADVARVAMGKKKSWGEKPHDAADEEPLAWWCLTEVIATEGPR